MSKKKERVCKICLKAIGSKENFVRLTEYSEGRELSNGWYHTQCFRDRFMNFKKIQDQANAVLSAAQPLLKKVRGVM